MLKKRRFNLFGRVGDDILEPNHKSLLAKVFFLRKSAIITCRCLSRSAVGMSEAMSGSNRIRYPRLAGQANVACSMMDSAICAIFRPLMGRFFMIHFPFGRIVGYVCTDSVQGFVVADYVFVIIALPLKILIIVYVAPTFYR